MAHETDTTPAARGLQNRAAWTLLDACRIGAQADAGDRLCTLNLAIVRLLQAHLDLEEGAKEPSALALASVAVLLTCTGGGLIGTLPAEERARVSHLALEELVHEAEHGLHIGECSRLAADVAKAVWQ